MLLATLFCAQNVLVGRKAKRRLGSFVAIALARHRHWFRRHGSYQVPLTSGAYNTARTIPGITCKCVQTPCLTKPSIGSMLNANQLSCTIPTANSGAVGFLGINNMKNSVYVSGSGYFGYFGISTFIFPHGEYIPANGCMPLTHASSTPGTICGIVCHLADGVHQRIMYRVNREYHACRLAVWTT